MWCFGAFQQSSPFYRRHLLVYLCMCLWYPAALVVSTPDTSPPLFDMPQEEHMVRAVQEGPSPGRVAAVGHTACIDRQRQQPLPAISQRRSRLILTMTTAPRYTSEPSSVTSSSTSSCHDLSSASHSFQGPRFQQEVCDPAPALASPSVGASTTVRQDVARRRSQRCKKKKPALQEEEASVARRRSQRCKKK